MICSTTLTVRSARAITSKLPTIARPICANASFSTSSKLQTQQPKAATTCLRAITRPSISPPKASVRLTIRSSPSSAIRHNSTAASPGAASAPASSPSSPNEPLTWNRFLALRKIRRRISLVASIVCGVAGSGAGFALLATTNMESMGAQMSGLDPMVILGLGAVGCGTIGWLMGPFFGGTIFTLFWRGARGGFAEVRSHAPTLHAVRDQSRHAPIVFSLRHND